MEKSFGARLAALRKAGGLSQTETADYVTRAGYPVRTQAVSKWETGATQPSAGQFLALCRLYRVRDVLAAFAAGEDAGPAAGRVLPLYRLAVSAGTGEFLESAGFDPVEVGEEVSAQADFGVRIAGDSMEPRFVHGQIVWVKRQAAVEPGEIGIFAYNGEGFCKRLGRDAFGPMLLSLNPRYPPIRVGEGDELRVFGKVVG